MKNFLINIGYNILRVKRSKWNPWKNIKNNILKNSLKVEHAKLIF